VQNTTRYSACVSKETPRRSQSTYITIFLCSFARQAHPPSALLFVWMAHIKIQMEVKCDTSPKMRKKFTVSILVSRRPTDVRCKEWKQLTHPVRVTGSLS
jgi:hypothetical protein